MISLLSMLLMAAAVALSFSALAALTDDRNTESKTGEIVELPVAASTTIYAGSLVMLDADGYAVPGDDTANCVFAGVATEQVDNSSGSDGDLTVEVKTKGVFRFDCVPGVDATALGGEVSLVDDQTVADPDDTSETVDCGRIVRIEGWNDVWIAIDHYALIGRTFDSPTTAA